MLICLVAYGACPALAGGDQLPAVGNGGYQSGGGGSQPGPQGPQQGPDYTRADGDGNIKIIGQAGYGNGNAPPGGFQGMPRDEWQKWASAYRSAPKYPYVFNFSGDGGRNVSPPGQKWFNDSWDDSRSGMAKKVAGLRVRTLLREMDMLRTMASGSGLGAEERAALLGGIDDGARRLEAADAGIQAAGDMKSLGQAVAGAEPYMAAVRSEVKANAGLLACRNMDTRIGQAMNASDVAYGRIQSQNLTPGDKALYLGELAAYDRSVYNASQYQTNARESFKKYYEARNDTYYMDGLRQEELAQNELDAAFMALKGIFYGIGP